MRILTISDCPSPLVRSGLSRVHRHVIDACLECGHQIYSGAWFCDPKLHKYKTAKIYPLRKDIRKSLIDIYEIMAECKPEIVITCGDYWDFLYMKALKIKNTNFRWIAYLTVDTEPINEKLSDLFSYMDEVLVPSEWGCEVTKKYNKNVHHVPYGVDDAFYRMEKEKIEKHRKNKELNDIFRIIVVATNSERKHLPEALLAISKFANGKKDVKAYIHTNIGSNFGYDLRLLRSRYKLDDIVEFAPDQTTVLNGCDDSVLNIEYNCSNVFLSTSSNEGFCLPAIEAMSCGLPIIAGNHTSFKELIPSEVGMLYKTIPIIGMLESLKFVPDNADAAEKLEKMYGRWKENGLEGYKVKCAEFAKKFKWEKTKEGIKKFLNNKNRRILIPTETLIGA